MWALEIGFAFVVLILLAIVYRAIRPRKNRTF